MDLSELTEIAKPDFKRLDSATLQALGRVPGLTATASDLLDAAGWRLAIPAASLVPRAQRACIAGHALTLRYVPARHQISTSESLMSQSRLIHQTIYDLAGPGDVMVIETTVGQPISVLGGRAAAAGARAKLAGAIIDGGVRDLDQIQATGFPVWSRWVTPITGKGRVEPVSINGPVSCGAVQVRAGDLVLADASGIVLVPNEIAHEIAERIFRIAQDESTDFEVPSTGQTP